MGVGTGSSWAHNTGSYNVTHFSKKPPDLRHESDCAGSETSWEAAVILQAAQSLFQLTLHCNYPQIAEQGGEMRLE